ncbi:MAG: hypothetical protein KKG99_12485 [Bacteroidetes bacterium]|nr:hypothetical protein [Bacteroidota bacterium]
MVGNPPGKIIKEYPARGPIKQYRFDKVIAFTCFRCDRDKKSKLITIYSESWNKRLCNGCYGWLLSIHEIKSGTKSEDEKVEDLSVLLTKLVSEDEVRQEIKILKIKENRAEFLNEKTLRFIASSEYISSKLDNGYSLDWSPVVIGLCKAFENELVVRLIRPFKEFCMNLDLSEDSKDKDIGRIASYIKNGNSKDIEIGTFGHFLQTTLNSKKRRETSILIKNFFAFISQYHHSNWLLDNDGLLKAISSVSKDFRNKAAHIEELNKSNYSDCRKLMIGESGVLWNLNYAIKQDTKGKRE